MGFQFDHESAPRVLDNSANEVSHQITGQLTLEFPKRPLFATTSSEAMKRALMRAGFIQQGQEWLGRYGKLSLWIKITA